MDGWMEPCSFHCALLHPLLWPRNCFPSSITMELLLHAFQDSLLSSRAYDEGKSLPKNADFLTCEWYFCAVLYGPLEVWLLQRLSLFSPSTLTECCGFPVAFQLHSVALDTFSPWCAKTGWKTAALPTCMCLQMCVCVCVHMSVCLHACVCVPDWPQGPEPSRFMRYGKVRAKHLLARRKALVWDSYWVWTVSTHMQMHAYTNTHTHTLNK